MVGPVLGVSEGLWLSVGEMVGLSVCEMAGLLEGTLEGSGDALGEMLILGTLDSSAEGPLVGVRVGRRGGGRWPPSSMDGAALGKALKE